MLDNGRLHNLAVYNPDINIRVFISYRAIVEGFRNFRVCVLPPVSQCLNKPRMKPIPVVKGFLGNAQKIGDFPIIQTEQSIFGDLFLNLRGIGRGTPSLVFRRGFGARFGLDRFLRHHLILPVFGSRTDARPSR